MNVQKTMFDTAKELSRPIHPETSKEAAVRVLDTPAERERASLALVRQFPGRTGAELDRIHGAGQRQISKRLAGLVAKGTVKRGEIRVCEVLGSRCVTWLPIT